MKSRNLFLGVIILFSGIIALLSVLNVFEFHWSILWRLWPVFLIIIGISLLPFKEYVKTLMLLVALGLGCWLYQAEAENYEGNAITRFFNRTFSSWTWSNDDDEDEEDADEQEAYATDQHFSEPYAEVERASIDIDFGAGDLEIKNPCAELVTVDAVSNFVKYSFRTEPKEGETAIFLNGKGHSNGSIKSATNDLKVALCTHPVWNFSLDMGAADADLDLSPYKVEKVVINGGACDLDLKLGNYGGNTVVDINTGASDIDIQVPTDAYCQINIKSAISGKDFTGFEKMANGQWQTPNYEQASTRIVINMSCAVSDVSVTRY